MAAQTGIKAITFDLDDTLWPLEPVLREAEIKTYAWLSQHAKKLTASYSRDAIIRYRNQLFDHDPQYQNQISAVRHDTYQRLAIASGYSVRQAKEIALQAFDVFLEYRQQVNYFDHVEATIEQLARDYLLGAVTNGNADLKKIAIGRYFTFSVSAEQVNASKPAKKIFTAALTRANQIQGCTAHASQFVHVGDDLEKDVLGASRAGFKSVWYRPDSQCTEHSPTLMQHANATISSIDQLPAAIKRL